MDFQDTIFALASARGRAGVSVVRVSGSGVSQMAQLLVGGVKADRKLYLKNLRHPGSNELLDQCLVAMFPGPNSFTGEDVLEFHLHGSNAVVKSVLGVLSQIEKCVPAGPGDFTRRALLNGKMDLTEVEGLSDLIVAETDAQRRQASRNVRGELCEKVDNWRKKLIQISSLITASIDFSDEELPENLLGSLASDVSILIEQFSREVDGSAAAEIIRSGLEVVILGKPNVGKSSLLNNLAKREVAITSRFAGTTRDIIEVDLDVNGYSVKFVDTAGLRATRDEVESIGISRARVRAENADVRLYLVESLEDINEIGLSPREKDLVVQSKVDTVPLSLDIGISVISGEGMVDLERLIEKRLSESVAGASSIVGERQKHDMSCALNSLRELKEVSLEDGFEMEVAAEILRQVMLHLDRLVGRVDIETVLGEIFANFCIGK